MFGDHFYHAILRKSVAVFGTLFNDIRVVRKDNAGIVKDQQRVPLSYGPKQKFLSRLDQQADLSDPKIAIKLPRMSFEITNMSYDTTTKTSSLNTITAASSATTRSTVGQMTPYMVDMQLNIIAKNQDDALQIFEQIVPYFQPTYTLSVKFIDELEKSFDVPITLNSISIQDDYEGEFTSRRSLIYTLDFSMKVKFFGPSAEQGVITTVSVDVNNIDTFGFIEEITTESTLNIIPATANAVLVGDSITSYEFTNRGRGYSTPPSVTIDPPQTPSGVQAAFTPTLVDGTVTANVITNSGLYYRDTDTVAASISGLYDNNGVIEEFTEILQVNTLSGRVSLVYLPNTQNIVTITEAIVDVPLGTPADFTAQAEATVVDGRIGELIPTSFGIGYTSVPKVSIGQPDTTDATYAVFQGVDNTDDNQIT
jgi:hypothetical protein